MATIKVKDSSGNLFWVDPEFLAKIADLLDEPAANVKKVVEHGITTANSIKGPDGGLPWGDGEIGEAFQTEYLKYSDKAFQGARGLAELLVKLAERFKESAAAYAETEKTNQT